MSTDDAEAEATIAEPGAAARAPDGAEGGLWRGHVVIVTGRSGAGRTTAINCLEDLGFERVDRPPLGLASEVVRQMLGDGRRRIAIGVDARTVGFSPSAFRAVRADLLAIAGLRLTVVFLDGADEVLRRRYSETRRRHPLAPNGSIEDGIALDRSTMLPLKDSADLIVDTSDMAPAALKRALIDKLDDDRALGLTIDVVSFAYKRGVPANADIVFDCRFLRNPHYDPVLRDRDGRDPDVAAYVAEDPLFEAFFASVRDHALLLLPAYEAEGKSYLTIAFGCTGGKHRSVATAERLAATLRDAGWPIDVRHRERERVDRAAREALTAAKQATGE